MAAVQIAAVARRAGIAAGTVYRYFPGKTDLVAAMIEAAAAQEIAAMRKAADAAPGPLSALAACVLTFAARAARQRRLIFALLAEPAEADISALRAQFRRDIAAELDRRIVAAMTRGHLPEQNTAVASAAVIGAVVEGLIGPLAVEEADAVRAREQVQQVALIALRALGIVDARARGVVVQTVLPANP